MQKKEYDKFIKRVSIAYQKITGREYGFEDCAQWILLQRTQGKGSHQTVDQSVIDYLRTQWGHKRCPGFGKRFNLDSSRVGELKSNHLTFDFRDLECEGDIHLYGKYLDTKEYKIIYKLIVVWGFSIKEVADLFEVTESLISQKFKKIKKCIIEGLKKHESGR